MKNNFEWIKNKFSIKVFFIKLLTKILNDEATLLEIFGSLKLFAVVEKIDV